MGILYIVATPIGNLEDITLRALRILREVDLILCEDTRRTRKLLSRHDIKNELVRFDAFMERGTRRAKVLTLLKEGKNVALVSDSGTPTISDPGAALVSAVREASFEVVAIPGPSAVTAALSVSGLPASDFLFLGFLPHKKGRETLFKEIAETRRTIVFYESPHRLIKTLVSLRDHLDENRHIVITKELTKIHEEVINGIPQEILEYFEKNPDKVRGEFVVIVSGCS